MPFWHNGYLDRVLGPGDLVFGRMAVDGAMWMPILEKAAAKLFGNYETLAGGWMGPAVQMMTGSPYFNTRHDSVSIDELWSYIDSKLN
jgi:hypothetical protein